MMECRQDGFSEGLATGREEGISIGLEQGLERGAYQKALETAKAFLFYGDSPEKVAICTGLPIEKVMELVDKR
jgi:predicted transposase YdaD